MRVRATKALFYGGGRHIPGTKTENFTIKDEPKRKLRDSDNEITRALAVDDMVPRDWSQGSMSPVSSPDLRGTVFDDKGHSEIPADEDDGAVKAAALVGKQEKKKKPTGEQEKI